MAGPVFFFRARKEGPLAAGVEARQAREGRPACGLGLGQGDLSRAQSDSVTRIRRRAWRLAGRRESEPHAYQHILGSLCLLALPNAREPWRLAGCRESEDDSERALSLQAAAWSLPGSTRGSSKFDQRLYERLKFDKMCGRKVD